MKFIRKNGRIIPIGIGYDKGLNGTKGTSATISKAKSYAKSGPTINISQSTNGTEKVSRTLSQYAGAKLNGFLNKFKTIDSGKMQSAYMFQKGKDIGNKIGSKVTTGTAKKVFEKQSIKSTSRLQRLSKLMERNKSAKGRQALLALSVIAGIGAYGYMRAKHKNQNKMQGSSV